MTAGWVPLAPDRVAGALAEHLDRDPGTVRVAIDGPPCAAPGPLAVAVVDALRTLGRPVVHVEASSFWHDASLRLEHGREDVESYRHWLDADALSREVLRPLVERGEYLPSLRDPVTNRSTRAPVNAAVPSTVLVVSGELLLGLGLPFDRVVHLAMSPAARARHTDPDRAWTLPAYDDYDTTVEPARRADIVVKLDDPRHPAVRGM